MITIKDDHGVPIHAFVDHVGIEPEAHNQLLNVSRLPFIFKHLAVMPDVHAGYGSSVGTVVPTQGAICPALVGVDIGCGMMAVKLPFEINALENLAKLRSSIEHSISVGFHSNNDITDRMVSLINLQMPNGEQISRKHLLQLGSLGGGNHFIEICKDQDNTAWVMLHSGSRNLGKTMLENHYGKNIWMTRKGAVSAREGQYGIIPGSMGAKSFIVKGKGNPLSFHSCSHGAGRAMSRTAARKRFTLEDHINATKGIECRKDADVIDETPMAYKSIDDVMLSQVGLVEIVYTLNQIICIKG